MLEKTEQKPDRLVFNDMKQLVLYYGDIEVRLGNDENMDEKMNRLSGILPQLEGMAGILHLENITEDTQAVVFDDTQKSDEDTSEEEQEGDTGEEPKEDTKENADENAEEDEKTVTEKDSKKENKEENQLEYTDGADAADTRSKKEE